MSITTPGDRAKVRLPVKVAWSATDLPSGTRYAVLVDRSPQPPGEALDWFARGDESCKARPDCPDETYLAERSVHVTDEPSISLAQLPARTTDRRYRDFHEVTVVLLDSDGRRIGESAWAVQFRVVAQA